MMTSQGITSGQFDQLNGIVESVLHKAILAALDEVSPSEEQAQLAIVENSGDFQAAISEGVTSVITKVFKRFLLSPEFIDEEVESEYGYFSDYKPSDIVIQIKRLQKLFPGIGYANEDLLAQIKNGKAAIPHGADGWFAIPHWSKVANTYQEALEKVLALLAQYYGHSLQSEFQSRLGPEYLRETSKKVDAMETLQERQGRDIILVPAQFGLRHRGRSVRRACAVMGVNEFGLGLFGIVIMLLTHPDRLEHLDDLWVDCPGDEYSHAADMDFRGFITFGFSRSGLVVHCNYVEDFYVNSGSASGFLPQ